MHEESKADEIMNDVDQQNPMLDRENPLNKSSNDVFKRLAMRDRKKTVSVSNVNDFLKPQRQTSQNHMLVRNNSNFS